MKPHVDLIIKFGGSAITEKDKLETLKPSLLHAGVQLVKECVNRRLKTVVVHGAG